MGSDLIVQGNLDPALVLAGANIALDGAANVLSDNGDNPGHIFNLGHGVQPNTDPGVLTEIVAFVHDQTARETPSQ
jgi:uroporphyrinogen decarboxylase